MKPRGPLIRFLLLTRAQAGPLCVGIGLVIVCTLLTLPPPWILKMAIDEAIPQKNVHQLCWLLAIFTAFFLLKAWLTLQRNRILQYAGMRLVSDLRIDLFTHLQTLSLRYFDNSRTGEIVSRISQDTGEVHHLTNGFLITVIADAITVLAVLPFLFWLDWRVALGVCAMLPLFALNFQQQRKRMRAESREHRKNWDYVVGFLHEKIASARVVKSFAQETAEVAAFTDVINADFFHYSRIVMRNTKMGVVAELLGAMGGLVVLGYGGWLVIRGQMQVGTLVAFTGYITFIFPPIVRFIDLNSVFQRATTGLENVFALLDQRAEIVDAPGARPLGPIRGDVEFRNVAFDYKAEPPGEGRPRTLTDVSFKISVGQTVAIVGPSGSGKSTVINLLARFYDPGSGEIFVDGQDIRSVTIESLRSQIGIVLQENILFSGTIDENLRYGKPGANREEIVAAARLANAHDFILGLPDGYQTMVGERGVTLSGGQRQRIAIARAVLKNPRILIFDEATSALDAESELLIQEAMERVMQTRTTFVIAHRLSTIHKADMILVMDGGRLAESGVHSELIAKNGIYSRLHALQFRPWK